MKKMLKKLFGKVGMEAFDVATMSEQGVKVPLSLPDGTETEEYLVVAGADTEAFKIELAKSYRETLKATSELKDDDAIEKKKLQIQTELVAILVLGWSFDKPCNKKNVVQFLKTAPHIQAEIDKFAGTRSNFFKKPPQD